MKPFISMAAKACVSFIVLSAESKIKIKALRGLLKSLNFALLQVYCCSYCICRESIYLYMHVYFNVKTSKLFKVKTPGEAAPYFRPYNMSLTFITI